eukprot:1748914-Pleurochrysis_carterae.AAC.3
MRASAYTRGGASALCMLEVWRNWRGRERSTVEQKAALGRFRSTASMRARKLGRASFEVGTYERCNGFRDTRARISYMARGAG